jgi:hypothetical protein
MEATNQANWDPSNGLCREYDDDEVEGIITIPATSAGAIIGKGGSMIQSISQETGATVSMSTKEDANFTHERILTISGKLSACSKFVITVLSLLEGSTDYEGYVFPGGYYDQGTENRRDTNREQSHRDHTNRINSSHRSSKNSNSNDIEAELLSATTTFTIGVPDSIIGAFLGNKVS